MPNSIHNLTTKSFKNDSGEFPAIVMALNIGEISTVDTFLDDVVEQFKRQRMCSPPRTANMTITIVGDMTAEDFRTHWIGRAVRDPILGHFMSLMVLADVLHIRGRELLDRASLISSSDEHCRMKAIARNILALPILCLAVAVLAELILTGICFALEKAFGGDSFISVGATVFFFFHLPGLLLLSLLGVKFALGFLICFGVGTLQFFTVFWCIAQMAKRIRSERRIAELVS